MIIQENRDSRCLSISNAQVSGAVVLCRMGGQVLLPSVSSDLLLLPGPRGKRGPKLSILNPKSPDPLPESHCPGDPSVEVCQPDAQVYLLLWDISRHSLLTDNTLSKEQQTDPVPCRSEPQSQVQMLGSLLGPAHPPQGALLCLTLHLPGLHHLCWCCRLCSESLKTWTWTSSWTPEGMEPPQHPEPHLDQIRGGLIASLLRVLI